MLLVHDFEWIDSHKATPSRKLKNVSLLVIMRASLGIKEFTKKSSKLS